VRAAVGTVATQAYLEALVASVAGLFGEDAGRTIPGPTSLPGARERGARQASVTAYAANHAAQRFYERHGFAPASITSRAPL
jgi:GNAT superfamily N-acetyltransferase